MNILSIDSSGPILSLTLKLDGKVSHFSDEQKSRASQIILSSIDVLLSKYKIELLEKPRQELLQPRIK